MPVVSRPAPVRLVSRWLLQSHWLLASRRPVLCASRKVMLVLVLKPVLETVYAKEKRRCCRCCCCRCLCS